MRPMVHVFICVQLGVLYYHEQLFWMHRVLACLEVTMSIFEQRQQFMGVIQEKNYTLPARNKQSSS